MISTFSEMESKLSNLTNTILNSALTTTIKSYITGAKPTVNYQSYTYTSSKYVASDITVTNASYTSTSNELTFTISYANTSATFTITYTLTITSSSPSNTSSLS